MENVIEIAKQYVKAFKEVKPELVEKHFLPNATKTGYFYDYEKSEWTDISTHSFGQISEWTKSYNTNGIMPDSGIQATLLDIQDKIAVVKIVAEWVADKWGCDYVFLVKENEEWRISSILWQSVV